MVAALDVLRIGYRYDMLPKYMALDVAAIRMQQYLPLVYQSVYISHQPSNFVGRQAVVPAPKLRPDHHTNLLLLYMSGLIQKYWCILVLLSCVLKKIYAVGRQKRTEIRAIIIRTI